MSKSGNGGGPPHRIKGEYRRTLTDEQYKSLADMGVRNIVPPLPPSPRLRNRMTGQLYAWTQMLADAPDIFECCDETGNTDPKAWGGVGSLYGSGYVPPPQCSGEVRTKSEDFSDQALSQDRLKYLPPSSTKVGSDLEVKSYQEPDLPKKEEEIQPPYVSVFDAFLV